MPQALDKEHNEDLVAARLPRLTVAVDAVFKNQMVYQLHVLNRLTLGVSVAPQGQEARKSNRAHCWSRRHHVLRSHEPR